MREKSLTELTAEVIETFAGYDAQGTRHWTWETAAKDLPYQIGSLSKLILQLSGDRWSEGKSDAQIKLEMSDELSDILAEVLFIASELNIDMCKAWGNMLASDRGKVGERVK